MLKKDLAGFFAFFLGIFGVHRFYLGQWWRGAAQFVGFWGVIALLAENGPELPLPFILVGLVLAPVITAIVFWATPYEKWAAKYDPDALTASGYRAGSITSSKIYRKGAAGPATGLPALKAEGVKYYRSGDYDLAVEAFEEAIEVTPTDPVAHFNAACCYALLGQYPAALRALEVATTHHLPKPERIETHPALRELRKSDAYRRFRQNNYRQLNLLNLTASEGPVGSEAEGEVLEDFGTPPRSDAFERRNPDSRHEEIARLQELYNSGILTQREFELQREKLLA